MHSFSQTCDGNLGANIFENGDFGIGSSNISPDFQTIAPGYNFTFQAPPNDGEFTVTNGTFRWGSFAATNWIQFGDNSADSDGYMMVINASVEPGLFYDQTIDGLCENALYEFSADAINIVKAGIRDHILPNVTFQIDGIDRFSSGNIPQDEAWKNYSFTFTTAPSQTSVRLSLRNNAPGGFGNDLAIDNISFRACGPESLILPRETEQICENGNPIDLTATINGDQYPNLAIQWQQLNQTTNIWEDIPGANGLTITHTSLTGGSYFYRYLLANGSANLTNDKCRIISNIKEVFVQPKFWFIQDSLCEGTFVEFKGQQLTQSGIYTDSLTSSIGCDSVVTYDLTFVPDRGIAVDFSLENPACIESNDGAFNINQVQNGTGPFSIFLNDELIDNTLILNQLELGNYNIRILDRYGCEWSDEFNLLVPDPFRIDLGGDLTIEMGETVNLEPQTDEIIESCEWFPPGIQTGLINCNELNIQPFTNTQVGIHTTSPTGCMASDSINITVLEVRKVFIPSAFTPNNDGINDVFMIFASVPNVQSIKSFMVFDRWGGLIFKNENFQPNEITEGWDGLFQGKPIDPGVYTYAAEIVFIDEKVKIFSGGVLVGK